MTLEKEGKKKVSVRVCVTPKRSANTKQGGPVLTQEDNPDEIASPQNTVSTVLLWDYHTGTQRDYFV